MQGDKAGTLFHDLGELGFAFLILHEISAAFAQEADNAVGVVERFGLFGPALVLEIHLDGGDIEAGRLLETLRQDGQTRHVFVRALWVIAVHADQNDLLGFGRTIRHGEIAGRNECEGKNK